jgi:D-arabinose 1-dehydrogenase-like Zn-dependent alcohol dehydrogenase
MEAAVLVEYGAPLQILPVPDPRPADDEIVIRVRACGMCYTDVKIADGQLAAAVTLPHVPGHEVAGEVVETGRNVRGLKAGDRGVCYFLLGCGECEMCRTGRENLCLDLTRLGFEHPGGWARYAKLPARNFCTFGPGAAWESMAVLPDAVATPFHALNSLVHLRLGQTVLIVGVGGLGLHAVQIAARMGTRVAAADVSDEALAAARRCGAELAINPRRENPREAVLELTRGLGADVVLEGVGREESLAWSLPLLKKGGTCIIMGYDAVRAVPISLLGLHNNGWRVVGSKVSTRRELEEVVRLVERGVIEPLVSRRIALEEVNDGLAAVRRGEARGRTVIVDVEDSGE